MKRVALFVTISAMAITCLGAEFTTNELAIMSYLYTNGEIAVHTVIKAILESDAPATSKVARLAQYVKSGDDRATVETRLGPPVDGACHGVGFCEFNYFGSNLMVGYTPSNKVYGLAHLVVQQEGTNSYLKPHWLPMEHPVEWPPGTNATYRVYHSNDDNE